MKAVKFVPRTTLYKASNRNVGARFSLHSTSNEHVSTFRKRETLTTFALCPLIDWLIKIYRLPSCRQLLDRQPLHRSTHVGLQHEAYRTVRSHIGYTLRRVQYSSRGRPVLWANAPVGTRRTFYSIGLEPLSRIRSKMNVQSVIEICQAMLSINCRLRSVWGLLRRKCRTKEKKRKHCWRSSNSPDALNNKSMCYKVR